MRLLDEQQIEKHTMLPLVIPPPKLHLFDIEGGKRIGKWFKDPTPVTFQPNSLFLYSNN